MSARLDDIFWLALSGPQRGVSIGTATARRLAPGFSPIVAFADHARPDFAALAPFCEPHEHFYCAQWTGEMPPGWRLVFETTMFKMVWASDIAPDHRPIDAVRLGPAHAGQAVDLALSTRPGPFGPRTIELGEYFGCFDGPRLVAMVGERLWMPPYRELSALCTHPDYQGRGLARALSALIVRRILARGEMPFLHVVRGNDAHAFYGRMGFRDYHEIPVRVIAR